MTLKRWVLPILTAWALMLTAFMGVINYRIETAYLDRHSYFYDAVSYSYYNASLYQQVLLEGRWQVAANELRHNARMPLRTVPLVLLAPELLAHRMGFLATALPMLSSFLFLLGWTVYRRSGSGLYAAAGMLLFCTLRGLFDPTTGLGANWLDLHAAFLVGGAALCLLNSSEGRDLRWLAAFGILAALAALSRYVAAVYVFFVCAPVLAYYLIRRWRTERRLARSVLLPLAIISSCIAVPAGYFLVAHFREVVSFYAVYGQQAGFKDVASSAQSVISILAHFLGKAGLAVVVGLLVINLVVAGRPRGRDWIGLALMAWMAAAIVIYLVLVVRVVGHLEAPVYAVPLLFILAVCPMVIPPNRLAPRREAGLVLITLAAVLLVAWRGPVETYRLTVQSGQQLTEQKRVDIALAEAVAAQGDSLLWNAYFDEYSWIPTMEAFYRFGKFPLPAGQDYIFSVHEAVYAGNYPGRRPEELGPLYYANARRFVDVAVVFADPAQAEVQFDNPYSRAVGRYITQAIQTDPNWVKVFEVSSQQYGLLMGYRNLAPDNAGAYLRRLHNEVLATP